MSIYDKKDLKAALSGNPYPGRGIIIGTSPDGEKAVFAYFIMGRSDNSRNRVFTEKEDGIYTEPFDVSKVEDPSLIIYRAVAPIDEKIIVTNGDQTDTIYNFMKDGFCMKHALRTREFEPDAPNFTPRISGVLNFSDGYDYEMSILKSMDEKGSECARYFYEYKAIAGLGHFIHTYETDGNPLPTFQGEPERVELLACIDEFTETIWNSLNSENKISLYTQYVDIKTKEIEKRLINKNK